MLHSNEKTRIEQPEKSLKSILITIPFGISQEMLVTLQALPLSTVRSPTLTPTLVSFLKAHLINQITSRL